MSTVLVVIPTLNEATHVEDCLRSLICENAQSPRVLVMDGGSRDGTCEIVRKLTKTFPNVEVRANPHRMQSAAVNLAAQGASEDILIRCDAHAVYPHGYIDALTEAMACTGADSVVVPMDAVGRGCFQRAVAWIVDTPLGSGGSAHRGGATSGYIDHGHHAAFSMEKFKQVGGYDETFSHNEDAEYDHRLALAGGRIWLDANIRLGYFPRDTIGGLWKQYRNYGRGRARMLMKHALIPKPRQMIPVLNLIALAVSAIVAPFAPWAGLVWPAAYFALLCAASFGVALWKWSLCGLLAGPALAVIHNAWALGFIETALAARFAAKPAAA